MKNFYEVLRVRTNATQEQIKKAYMELVRKYHPDVYRGDRIYGERYTAVLTEAYSVLRDPEKRSEYDKQHNINTSPSWKELIQEDYRIRKAKYEEKHTPRKNYEQEMSMRYFKNAERRKPVKKNILLKILTSKLFYSLLFVVGVEIAIILLIYNK